MSDAKKVYRLVTVKYWLDHYATLACTLCGNRGVIDTRGVKTAAGVEVGRLNWCMCPNGQTLRMTTCAPPTEQDLLPL